MYIRRPLCVFSLLFVLILSGVMAVTGRAGPYEAKEYDGQELEFTGRIKQIDHKDHNMILHIKNILLQ